MFRRVPRCIESPHGDVRFEAALRWLTLQERAQPLLVVAHSLDAARDLLRAATLKLNATFGWELESLTSLTSKLAALPLAQRGLTAATPLSLEAVCVRAVAQLQSQGRLGRFAHVAERPGLPPALLRTFTDLALADVEAPRLAKECPELATAFELYRQMLQELSLADRSDVVRAAMGVVRDRAAAGALPAVCLYDLAPKTKLERALVSLLGSATPTSFVSCATGETPETSPEPDVPVSSTALQRLQAQLFTSSEVPGTDDGTTCIFSAPGESRECVEIARRVLEEAARGVPFDRMAILLRSPYHYRTHLVEALRRASVPAHFTRGAVLPEPGGRALLVLLRCAAEGLSAVRFAEYLSLGVAKAATHGERDRAVPPRIADEAAAALLGQPPTSAVAPSEADEAAIIHQSLFPRRWEALLVDAAVVGGADRWRRRLAGLEQELTTKASLEDDPTRTHQTLAALRALGAFALPLVEQLAALPASGTWGQWLEALRELTQRAIRRPEAVQAVLAELDIMRDVGPISLTEVAAVLEERLGEIQVPAATSRGGQVLVASVEEARGRVFDVVFVPGLAEKLFPQRVVEDPLLSDRSRGNVDAGLETQVERVQRERQALRVAVGCAKQRLILSYPRFESDKARPRVPSFYALEAIRAAEGVLPGFAALARRADAASATRMGWPAPEQPESAIDESEYDLATLRVLLGGRKSEVEGAARYLVTENRTLGRALQARARRWRPEWRNVDGLVDPSAEAREALKKRYEELQGRGFSVTALEKLAACPYRFYLATVVGLRPRDAVHQVEELDPATRGVVFHEIVHQVALELKRLGIRTSDEAQHAEAVSDQVIARVTATWRERLAPAIGRVWEDAVEDLRLDVRYWLRELLQSDWQLVELELPFGLHAAAANEERAKPVMLDSGLALRGQIDAVEQRQGELRATDYKTSEAPAVTNSLIAGGTALQPALYALVVEKLFPNTRVSGGNAYYCTTRGGFARRQVELNEWTRKAAAEVARAVEGAFSDGFFPAAPAPDTCERCEFRVGCGPYERERVALKQPARLEALEALRKIR
ncbi:MAG: ATP-dependent nuclease, subunit [Polyangiaceae bacterium]|jgi:CRISPR/Cas system-associated exonuclease Cas4 (RecB family)|nr:ATP-dependent nuclease, subunit [Polyangiaceae bacterium]